MLAVPDEEKPCVVLVDACSVAIGALLKQGPENGQLHPVPFDSRSLTTLERRYGTFKQEGVAVVFRLKRFRHFLLSGPFIV